MKMERSNIGRFVSKTFRETFLKENITPDSPLKGYEIAEAGVSGLNKLLGWEMALDKNNDENGSLAQSILVRDFLSLIPLLKKVNPCRNFLLYPLRPISENNNNFNF